MEFVNGELYERSSINLITGLHNALMEVNTPFVSCLDIADAVVKHRKENNMCITTANSIEQCELFKKTYVIEDGLAFKQNKLMVRKCQDTIKRYDFISRFANYIYNPGYIKDLQLDQEKEYYYIADKFEPYKNQKIFKSRCGIRKVTEELEISDMENESMYDQVIMYDNLYLVEFKVKKFLVLDRATLTTSSFFGFIFKDIFFQSTIDFVEKCTHKAVVVFSIKMRHIIHTKNIQFSVHKTNADIMKKDGKVMTGLGNENDLSSGMNKYRKYMTYDRHYMKYLMRPYKSREKELYSIPEKKIKVIEPLSQIVESQPEPEPEPYIFVPLNIKINFTSNIINRDKIYEILTKLVKQKDFFSNLYDFYGEIFVIKDVEKNYTDQKYFNFIFGKGKNRSECFHAYINDIFEIISITRIQNVLNLE